MPSGRTVQPRILLLAVPVLAMLAYSHDAIFARLATADPLVVAAGGSPPPPWRSGHWLCSASVPPCAGWARWTC